MFKKVFTLLISLFVVVLIWGADIQEIENTYLNGTLHLNHNYLRISSNDQSDVSACKLYFTAKLNTKTDVGKTFYVQAYQKDSRSKYGQLAYLELAKIDFFHRDYDNALEKLKNLDQLNERFYWQARVYALQKKWAHVIVSTENYLNKESEDYLALDLNTLLLDVYLIQNKSAEFFSVKSGMEKHRDYPEVIAYILYKEGLLHEKQNDLHKAIDTLRQIVEKYPKSQYRVYADDLILDYNKRLQQTVKPVIAEPETKISQPQIPKTGTSKKQITFTELEKGKSYLQYGLFSTQKAAENYKQQLESRGISLFVITKIVNDKEYFALIQGPFTSKESANTFLANVKNNNINAFLFIP